MSVPNSNGVGAERNNGPPGQPHVRHIPIYVEGRDEPILNKTAETTSNVNVSPATSGNNIHAGGSSNTMPQKPQQPPSSSGGKNSIFSRVKNFPVRQAFDNDFFQGQPAPVYQRASSPARTGTVPVSSPSQPPPQPAAVALTSIEKIQSIQREVLALMDQVEQFTGTSRKDKQYKYLDEMLTQNLLKLDTIDTEGKENIKQARREAIKCINICIAALEKKTDAAAAAAESAGAQ